MKNNKNNVAKALMFVLLLGGALGAQGSPTVKGITGVTPTGLTPPTGMGNPTGETGYTGPTVISDGSITPVTPTY